MNMNKYDEMNKVLQEQKEFFIANGPPSIDLRIDRLQRLKSLIMDNRYKFVDSLNSDLVIDQKMPQCYQMSMG